MRIEYAEDGEAEREIEALADDKIDERRAKPHAMEDSLDRVLRQEGDQPAKSRNLEGVTTVLRDEHTFEACAPSPVRWL